MAQIHSERHDAVGIQKMTKKSPENLYIFIPATLCCAVKCENIARLPSVEKYVWIRLWSIFKHMLSSVLSPFFVKGRKAISEFSAIQCT